MGLSQPKKLGKRWRRPHKGLKGTPESRAKQSAALKGAANYNYGRYGELHPTYGIKKTEKQIQEIKDRYTPEIRAEYSKRVLGENNPMYGKCGALNPAAKSVICLNNNMIFETLREAAKWCGLSTGSCIGAVCSGKSKSAGKDPITNDRLIWMYLEDYNKNTTNQ